jgi:protein-disulfide isomerase
MEKQKKYFLPVSILIAAVLIAGALIYSVGKKNTNTGATNNLSAGPKIENEAVLGDSKAPVTIFIFSDYQCPFCGKFFKETEMLLRRNYVDTGKAKMIYKSLTFLGPESTNAAEAALCARDQGKFWEYHDALFEIETNEFQTSGNNENTGNLSKNLFEKIASDLKIDTKQFSSCFDSQKYQNEITKTGEEAAALMDRVSTPTIFINDQMVQGAYPYGTFADLIDKALNKK